MRSSSGWSGGGSGGARHCILGIRDRLAARELEELFPALAGQRGHGQTTSNKHREQDRRGKFALLLCCRLGDGSRRPLASRRQRNSWRILFFFLTKLHVHQVPSEFLTTPRLNTNTGKRKRVARPIPIPRPLFAARAPRPWPCARGPPKCRGKRGYTNQFKEASESTTPLYARSTVAG